MAEIIFWGVIASPYQLKMQALADSAHLSWERWPEQAGRMDALGMLLRLNKARKRKAVLRYPRGAAGLDEYPSVPYYSFDGRQFYYDSTGLALHLDERRGPGAEALLPTDPGMRFACRLIDEAFDEFGLYMVHHNRWVTSAKTTPMGRVTAAELAKLYPLGLKRMVARKLPQRQVRRCPYLFSVAPAGFDAGVEPSLTPPSREGFPATHGILDTAWRRYLAALEGLLQQQPYLLGDRFTLADASAYGQLGMNMIDGVAAELFEELAPTTWRWLCGIRDGEHKGSSGPHYLSEALSPLLAVVAATFVPLMQQNAAAYRVAREQGETLFNEAAFDEGRSLYDGSLMGKPFRAVAKSFQVAVWRELCAQWEMLDAQDRQQLLILCPDIKETDFNLPDG